MSSKSTERIPISKGKRFEIFSRDQFTCKYCGRQPPQVMLVVDHVIPVSRGGCNADENLTTSCNECNQGKGSRRIAEMNLPAEERAKAYQEQLEQIDTAAIAVKAVKSMSKIRDSILDYFCEATGGKEMKRQSISFLCNLVSEFDCNTVLRWIDIANAKLGGPYFRESDMMRYIGGIAKRQSEESMEAA